MPDFIRGVPAQGSLIISSQVRNNFNALDDRIGHLTPKATVPASTTIQIGKGKVYLGNNIFFQITNGAVLDLGDPETGILPFLSSHQGFFKDVAITLKVTTEQVAADDGYGYDFVDQFRPVTELVGIINFTEGPEKSSSTLDPTMVNLPGDEIPINYILVRNDGGIERGDIEPIEQEDILDARPYLNAGSGRSYSAIVGDREVTDEDGYGDFKISGFSTGDYIGKQIIDVNLETSSQVEAADYSDPIQRAIDSLGDQGGVVFLRRGIYVPEQTIVVPSNVTIMGEGAGTVIKRRDSDGYGPEGYGVFLGAVFKFEDARDSGLKNLKVVGPGVGAVLAEPLVQLQNSTHCRIESCHIEDNLGIGPFGASGIELIQDSNYNIIVNNFIINNRIGIFIQGSSGNIIHGNIIGVTGVEIVEVEIDLVNSIRDNISESDDIASPIDGAGNLGDLFN